MPASVFSKKRFKSLLEMVCAYTPQTESPEVSLWRCRDDQVNFVCIRERLLNKGPNNRTGSGCWMKPVPKLGRSCWSWACRKIIPPGEMTLGILRNRDGFLHISLVLIIIGDTKLVIKATLTILKIITKVIMSVWREILLRNAKLQISKMTVQCFSVLT